MDIQATAIPGCFALQPVVRGDERGSFTKVFQQGLFQAAGLRTDFAEEYYSLSRQRVLRGLHFQLPPHQHAKLVYCTQGRVLDAVLDLRAGSATFGHHLTLELSQEQGNMLYLPAGLAHGFYTLSEQATMVYKVTSEYAPAYDSGVRWDTAGIAWPDPEPIVSSRDRAFAALADFNSPFRHE